MNERATPAPGADVEPWQQQHQHQHQQHQQVGEALQHSDQSAFAVHSGAVNRNLHHHLYPHHSSPRLIVKGGAMANGVNELDLHHHANHRHHHHHSADSDADEEVRSLDLPAQVGIDLRSKRSASTEALDRERPMSWEGELSDQEVSQMEHETNRGSSPMTQPAAPSDAGKPLKTEPINDEDDEDEMDGIQSVGPGSPQPMCTNADGQGGEVPGRSSVSMPPPTSLALGHPTGASAAVETGSLQHKDRPAAQVAGPSSGSGSGSGSTPTAPRPSFADAFTGHTPLASPLTSRHPIRLPLTANGLPHPPTPSPDSAIHSAYYSPTASPGQSRHRSGSGLSSPYSHRASPSLSRNNSDASQYSVHSQYGGSQYSYSSAPSPLSPSPAQSPVQPRHMAMLSAAYGPRNTGAEFPPSPLLYRHAAAPFPGATPAGSLPGVRDLEIKSEPGAPSASHPTSADTADDSREALGDEAKGLNATDLAQHTASLAAQAGISRQQLINSPCPICGDKISGFHYGIFSCESCKGFFKRTVQNKKNYVCLRGAACPVTIATRKKCPACRFEKCLNTGMKLEAIREDRTRGGRSTYQCTYAVPGGSGSGLNGSSEASTGASGGVAATAKGGLLTPNGDSHSRSHDSSDWPAGSTSTSSGAQASLGHQHHHHQPSATALSAPVPTLLLEIMNVEHLWHSNEQESGSQQHRTRPCPSSAEGDSVSSLCSIADHRLYKIVKWCKSLPLFKNIQIDDQISLLINTWCELLLFACCFRSVPTPGEIRISHDKRINLEQARALGLGSCIERMIHFTDHLRRLRVDQFEYAAMKVIILLSSDTSGLKESESVRSSQESVLKALQEYTLSHYPDVPSKFGELLLRIPELERTCQVGKDMLAVKREGDGQGFNLLMELLRGDH